MLETLTRGDLCIDIGRVGLPERLQGGINRRVTGDRLTGWVGGGHALPTPAEAAFLAGARLALAPFVAAAFF
ncbi:MAG: hypothetical protein WCG47_02675, partial [Dermatophilaceae bacterium]